MHIKKALRPMRCDHAGGAKRRKSAWFAVALLALIYTTVGRNTLFSDQEVRLVPSNSSGNWALEFDGFNDYVQIPSNPNLDLREDLTISAWVRSHGDHEVQIFWRGDTRGGVDPYLLHVNPDGKMEFRSNTGNGSITDRTVSRDLVDEALHLWTGVKDSRTSQLYLYKDGELESTTGVTQAISYDTSAMWNIIGAVDHGNWQHFDGVIDELQLWNRPLSQTEIRVYMYSTLKGNEPGLVGYWNFNEASGQVAHDGSGQDADGQLGQLPGPDTADPQWVASPVPLQTRASASWKLYP